MADDGATSSSSSKSSFIYDVFLSFRGEDTRHGFTDHLFKTLDNRGIKAFRDDPCLSFGCEIRPTLFETIERSRMSIVVFSQGYASSSWCLDELVKIVECKDKGIRVFPIFYHVEPSDVREQKNQYGKDIMKHENGSNSHKVQAWRLALSVVGNLSGRHCKGDSSETDLIDKICEEISKYLREFEGMEALKSNNKKEEEDIVGFEDSLSTVITQLKEENPSHNVVSITGMGGSGKTTLAQMIYDNNEVKNLFPYRAWSCVSEDFNEKKVLLELLKCLDKSFTSEYEKSSAKELKKTVTNCLNEKKYLVVLDDIWETRVWDEVKGIFPNCNNGSMILITSRDDRVANYSRSRTPHHQLPPLHADEGWELFCRKVFGKEECPHELVDVGKSIVKKCGGLPLAIAAMAGVVAMKDRLHIEWSQIEGSVTWDLAQDSTQVIDVLKMSYDHLPKMLKPCFLYFGIYPGGYKIIARELIQLWMAEGFIKPENASTSEMPEPEVLGDRYLKELVYRNLVQLEERRSDGGVKICRIHDLFRELCIIESKTDNFLEVCTESTMNSLSNSCRLSLLCSVQHYMSLIRHSQSSTRSLFFFAGERSPDSIAKNFPLVYVLHVARRVRFEENRADLMRMIHLKYLRIEKGNCVRAIPDWIWSFGNLETLDLRGWLTPCRTISIWKLERLKHLYIRPCVKLGVHKEGANNKRMWNLQTLTTVDAEPQTMLLINNGSFPNLTKLGFSYDSSPGHLTKLGFSYDSSPGHLLHEPPRSLNSLSKLILGLLDYWSPDHLPDERPGSLDPLSQLILDSSHYSSPGHLDLSYDSSPDHLLYERLGSLHHLSKLRTLKIHWCASKISLDGIVFPSTISKITLAGFDELDSGCMSALGRITSLRILKLRDGRTATDTLAVGSTTGDFPQLQVFHIEHLSTVKLLLTNGAMPRLQRTVIRSCPHLKEVAKRLLSLKDN